jgi:hypothetical protein
MSGGPPPKQRQVTDAELLRAVEHVCNTQRPPVAKSSEVTAVDFIDVKQQTVKRRLDKLDEVGRVGSVEVGRGKVWWPIDDGRPQDGGGEIYWDGIEPEQIPEEMVKEHPKFPLWDGIDPEEIPGGMIEEHPQFPDPDMAERMIESGVTILYASMIVTVVGMTLVLPNAFDLSYIPMPSQLQTVGAIATVGGFLFLILGMCIVIGGNVLSKTKWADLLG